MDVTYQVDLLFGHEFLFLFGFIAFSISLIIDLLLGAIAIYFFGFIRQINYVEYEYFVVYSLIINGYCNNISLRERVLADLCYCRNNNMVRSGKFS